MTQIFIKITKNHHKSDYPLYHLGTQIGHMKTLCDCVSSFDHLMERTLAGKQSREHQIAVTFFQEYMEVSDRFRSVDHDKRMLLHWVDCEIKYRYDNSVHRSVSRAYSCIIISTSFWQIHFFCVRTLPTYHPGWASYVKRKVSPPSSPLL